MTFSWGHGLYRGIEEDFRDRFPGYHKSRREGLSLLSALMLEVRSANLMELSSALPRDIAHMDERYRYVERLLSNAHIDVDEVSGGYAKPVLERLCENGETIVLMMDQSHINALNEVRRRFAKRSHEAAQAFRGVGKARWVCSGQTVDIQRCFANIDSDTGKWLGHGL